MNSFSIKNTPKNYRKLVWQLAQALMTCACLYLALLISLLPFHNRHPN
jgi:hypothetical protein